MVLVELRLPRLRTTVELPPGTKAEDLAAFERSDITAVPAAGVIGEAMLSVVLANSMREKFGGDSIEEMKRNFDTYAKSVADY